MAMPRYVEQVDEADPSLAALRGPLDAAKTEDRRSWTGRARCCVAVVSRGSTRLAPERAALVRALIFFGSQDLRALGADYEASMNFLPMDAATAHGPGRPGRGRDASPRSGNRGRGLALSADPGSLSQAVNSCCLPTSGAEAS